MLLTSFKSASPAEESAVDFSRHPQETSFSLVGRATCLRGAVLLMLSFLCTPSALAQVHLGLEFKDGYRDLYISNVDALGAGAIAGLRVGDRLVAINDYPTRFRSQVRERFAAQDPKQSISLLVSQAGYVRLFRFDPSARRTQMPCAQAPPSGNALLDCLLQPSIDDIEKLLGEASDMQGGSLEDQFSELSSRVSFLVHAGHPDRMVPYIERMIAIYPKLPSDVMSSIRLRSIIRYLALVESEPTAEYLAQARRAMVERNGEMDISSTLSVAVQLAKVGNKAMATPLLDDVLRLASSKPSDLKYHKKGLAEALVLVATHEQIEKVLALKEVEDDWRWHMNLALIEASWVVGNHAMAKSFTDSLLTLCADSYASDRPYGKLALLLRHSYSEGISEQLSRQLIYKLKNADEIFYGPFMSRSLAEVHAAQGKIAEGLTVLSEHEHGKSILVATKIKMCITASKRLLVASWSMQSVKGLRELVLETHVELQEVQKEEGKFAPSPIYTSELGEFYALLATIHLGQFDPKTNALQAFDERIFEKIIDNLIQSGSFPMALEWATAMMDRFDSVSASLALRSVFTGYGKFGNEQALASLKANPYYKKYKSNTLRSRVGIAAWKGDSSLVAKLYEQLSATARHSLFNDAFPFVEGPRVNCTY